MDNVKLIVYVLTYLSMAFTIFIVESITRIDFEGYAIGISEMVLFTLLLLLAKAAIKDFRATIDIRIISIILCSDSTIL